MIAASLILLALAAIAAPVLHRLLPRGGVLLLALVPFGLGCWFATMVPGVSSGTVVSESWPWIEDLGVGFSFRLDGLSLTFALLICFVGSFVLAYTSSYLRGNPRIGSFCATLLAFMTAMLGLVLADNLILLFAFWELTSITSFLLIGFESGRDGARRAALQALLVTGLGGLALLAGLVLLGLAAGGFEMADVMGGAVRQHPLYVPIVVLVLLGAFTKSAIFPFHFWLPNAMEAPSPVSALLHSATMVKAGVYLVARLHPALGQTLLWDEVLVLFGGVTMIGAAFLATRQSQLKRILAYSTVSSLGTLVMLIGLGAAKAAATYLLAHAMFKGCLFLVAGSVTKQTGEKDPERLGGLRRRMPITTVAAMTGALSMAGMFPLIGFTGKELVLKAGLYHPEWALPATILTACAGTLTVMAALLVGARPFIGGLSDSAEPARDPDWRQLAGPIVLAGAGVLAGVMPWLFAEPLVRATVASLEGTAVPGEARLRPLELLWPPTVATGLSFMALALGLGLYLIRVPYRRLGASLGGLGRFGADRLYDSALGGLLGAAAFQTRIVQNGSLQSYVRVTLLVVIATWAAALVRSNALATMTLPTDGVTVLDLAIGIVLVGAAISSTLQRSALASVIVLGAVGFVLALVFALYGSPDVAMTQFAVETLIVIIFVLVIFHLPRYSAFTGTWRRILDASVASLLGILATALTLVVVSRPAPESVSTYYAEHAVPDAFGRNVVNVILVDFRALDTLGEIFVIGVAAVGVHTLLRLRAAPAPREEAGA